MTVSFEAAAVWVLLCAVVAGIANAKGRSGVQWFVGALVFSPLIMGVLVLIVPSKPSPRVAGPGVADDIATLAALREAGHLTPDEYERQKTNLLG
jgi:hypothetical protein